MSRHHRANNLWPADELAVQIWHLVAALEDIADLIEASKLIAAAGSRTALVKKALVELKSFDDLIGTFQRVIRTSDRVPTKDRDVVVAALSEYHRTVEPSRELLADIRNTVGAHRRSLPDDGQRSGFGKDFRAWGAWEHQLADLESKCTLEIWLSPINAAIALRNTVVGTGLGSWFTIGSEDMRFYVPLTLETPGENAG